MSCSRVRSDLSEYMDGDLSGARLHAVSAHLESCSGCAQHLSELRGVSEVMASLPRLASPEPLAAGVFDRLEVESRGPGLALIFRSAWAARPLIFPSVVPAALVLVTTVSLLLSMGARDLRIYHEVAQGHGHPGDMAHAAGTDLDPFMPVAGVSLPVATSGGLFKEEALAHMGGPSDRQPFFFETTVTRDGRVRNLRLIHGEPHLAGALIEAMRYERFVPAQEDGRPVAVRTYRLFETVEVRAPLT
jgi:hypothetical protein